MNTTENSEKYTRWNTLNNGKIIPFTDFNLPTEFVLEHVKGAAIVEGELLLPICYDMSSVIDYYMNYTKKLSGALEISECIIYKYLTIPISFILENFPEAEIYYNEDKKKVLKLPNYYGIRDVVGVYKTYLVDNIVGSL